MKKTRSVISILCALVLLLGLCACGSGNTPKDPGEGNPDLSSPKGPDAAPSQTGDAGKAQYTVGICQLVQHQALDAATQGFIDALKEELGDAVTIENQNASNDIPTCGTIVGGFVASQVDLILANATPALVAAASATLDIPILGTAVTEYGVALDIPDFSGTVGGNISGTSDLAPLDQQAAMFDELLPEAKTIGILYCSAEPNSIYQAKVVEEALEKAGKTVKIYTFADSNDVNTVTQSACDECDALYIPTDNMAASCAAAIDNVALTARVPIIAGEEGVCVGCGIAALSINYYDLGVTTGRMAARILRGEADISEMPIEYFNGPVKKYDPARCEALGISIPEDYVPVG